jgi:hypothetical protein
MGWEGVEKGLWMRGGAEVLERGWDVGTTTLDVRRQGKGEAIELWGARH